MTDYVLYHHGVKGMKWGVRHDRNKGYVYGVKSKRHTELHDSDRTFKTGHEFQNVSFGRKRELSDNKVAYVSYKNHDNNGYSGKYSQSIARTSLNGKAVQNTIQLTKDVKVPSQKKAVEAFVDIYKSDPEGMSRSIAKASSDVRLFCNVERIRQFNEDRTYKKLTNKGEEWVSSKGYELFNQSLMSTKDTKARDAYFDKLISKGYSGLLDTNDVNNGISKDPIILITPKTSAKVTKSFELSQRDIEIASARYDWERDKDRGVSKYLDNHYEVKSNMKRVKKKYNLNDVV